MFIRLKPETHLAILYADRRDRRKSPGVPGAAIDFCRSPRSAYKIADIQHVRYRRLNSPSVPVLAILYGHYCESPVKSTHQVGRFYHMNFQNCHIAAIGEKNRQVCPHQSVAKIACDFRWRSNSPRSAYKIARCVAGLTDERENKRRVNSFLVFIFFNFLRSNSQSPRKVERENNFGFEVKIMPRVRFFFSTAFFKYK